MYFEYAHKSTYLGQKARKKYEWLFEEGLSIESIEARYLLLEFLRTKYHFQGKLEKDYTGKPLPIILQSESIYWSLSHSKNYVGFIVDSAPAGIDIVEIENRDDILLDTHTDTEYEILGGKNWINFYILWSAKEAIIKAKGANLESMEEIFLREKQENNLHIFDFGGQRCTISLEHGTDYIISIYLPSEYESSI